MGGEWAQAALEQLRFERDHPGLSAGEEAEPEGEVEEPAADDEEPAAEDGDASGESATATDDVDDPVDVGDDAQPAGTSEAAGPAVPSGNAAAGPAGPRTAGPDQALVDDTYDDFLRRFEQESGGEPSSS